MNPDLFLAILAMDSYNRGYGQGVLLNAGDSSTGQSEDRLARVRESERRLAACEVGA